MVVGLVVTPILLSALGSETYGAFRAASEWLAHLRLMDLGLAGALAPMLAAAVGRRDDEQVGQVLVTGARAYARVAVASLGIGLALALAMPALVPVRAELAADLRLGCAVAALGALVFPLLPAQWFADAEQRGYWTQLLLALQAPAAAALAVWLAFAGFGITGQMAAVTIGGAMPVLALGAHAIWRRPDLLRRTLRDPTHVEVRARMRRLGGSAFFLQLCGRASWFTDQGIVGIVLGPAAVVPLFVTQRLPTLVQLQLQSVGNASWAALADLAARGERERFNERLVELTRITAVLGAAALAPVVAWNEAFVALWVGPDRFGGWALTVVAAMNAQLAAAQSLWGWALSGTGRLRPLVPVLGIASVLNVGVSVALTMQLGILGPVLGTLVALLGWSIWAIMATLRREFGTPLVSLGLALVGPTLVGCAVAGVGTVTRSTPSVGWSWLLIEMAGQGLLTVAVSWVLLFPRAERVLWRDRLRRLLSRS